MQPAAGTAGVQLRAAPASALKLRSPFTSRAPRRQLAVYASTVKIDSSSSTRGTRGTGTTSTGTRRSAGRQVTTGTQVRPALGTGGTQSTKPGMLLKKVLGRGREEVDPREADKQAVIRQAVYEPPSSYQLTSDQDYFNVTGYPFPLGPLTKRATIRKELIRGTMWGFEQPQSLGFSNVTTNVRMTIVKLKSGGLWVHAPIAPTRECVRMVRQLERETGEKVKYIILPTFGYEHKIFVGPFSRRFPEAQVWVAPSTWSWPINLPVQFFGIFPTGILRNDATDTPWADEIEQKVFESSVGIGPYIEVAFFHKRTRTLLVTDAVVSVPNTPPELVPTENLVEAAARNFFINVLSGDLAAQPVDGVPLQPTELTPAVRDLGWRRMALQILYIVPGDLRDPKEGFLAIAERLIVGPILKTLVFSTTPEQTREWVESICCDWNFTSIVPAHFTAPVRATPSDLRAAFAFVYEPQLSAERQASAAAAATSSSAAAPAASRGRASSGDEDGSANPAKVLDKVIINLLGGLNASSKKAAAAKARPPPNKPLVQYPEEDIAALNAAKRFLVSAGVVNK